MLQNLKITLSLFALLLVAGQHLATAQCSDKALRKQAKKTLKPFNFETMAFVEFKKGQEHPDLLQSTFTVFRNEEYRVLIKPDQFAQQPEFSVYYGEGESRKLIFSNKENKNVQQYDFVAQQAGICTLEFEFETPIKEAEYQNNRCLSFVIGYQN